MNIEYTSFCFNSANLVEILVSSLTTFKILRLFNPAQRNFAHSEILKRNDFVKDNLPKRKAKL